MHIEAVDFFYLAMPEVTDEADGSQDALLVRVAAGGHVGWGECEAAPLPSIAAFVCPKSHGVCRPVADSVLGKRLSEPADIGRLSAEVAYNSMDLLQAPHTFSGIEMALWDVLGKTRGQPVWRMLGYSHSHPKTPYASVLFGDTPQETLARAKEMRSRNFIAAKFGWGPIGRGDARTDAEHFVAAREGLGPDGTLLVDTGQIFIDDVERAAERLPALEAARAIWFEEPFAASALEALWRARAALQHGEARGRRGRPQRPHGEAPDRLRPRRLHPDRLRAHRRHRPVESRSPTTRWRRASPSSTTPSRRTSRCRPRCSRSRGSPIIASASIRRCRSRSRSR